MYECMCMYSQIVPNLQFLCTAVYAVLSFSDSFSLLFPKAGRYAKK